MYIRSTHTYIHFDMFSASNSSGRVFTHIYQNTWHHVSTVNIF